MEIKSNNFCVVLSSPSGAGKTTISKMLLKNDKNILLSISCTTRPKRKGEINKKDYIFISDNDFNKAIKKNKFIEYANVFGFKYGTLKKTVDEYFKKIYLITTKKSKIKIYITTIKLLFYNQ